MRPHLRSVRPLMLALSVVGSLALAACSSSDDASQGAPADVGSADDGSAVDEDAGPRTIEHAMGSTEVPAEPERVVVLDSSFLDSSIALGVTPVGATEGIAGAGLPAYLGDDVADVELVGLTEEPTLEEVAALAPDLIIGAKVRHQDIYEQLSAIAPTVFSESSGTNWQDQVRLTGEALGRSDEAEQLLADVGSRAAQVGEQVGAADMTATIVRFIPGQIRLYGPGTFSGSVLESVGFDLGDKGYDEQYGMAVISQERLDLIDADVVFATNPGEESAGRISTDREAAGPLWEQLPAVVDGRQHDIADSTWMTGIGVLGANRILDDVESMLG